MSKPITESDGAAVVLPGEVTPAAAFDPTPAQAAIMQAAFATSVLPSMKNLAAVHFPVNIATLQTFDAVRRLADVYRMPTWLSGLRASRRN